MPSAASSRRRTSTRRPAGAPRRPVRWAGCRSPTRWRPWSGWCGGRSTSADGGIENCQRAGVGVEPGTDPERQRPLVLDMADRKAVGDRDAEWAEIGLDDFVEGERAAGGLALHLGEAADGDAGEAAERARQPQMGEHAIDAIEILMDVLE